MIAQVIKRRYTSGRVFYVVQCDDCGTVLNSGHHYQVWNQVYAQQAADSHNQTTHPEVTP